MTTVTDSERIRIVGHRATWRTLRGSRSGRIVMYNGRTGTYTANCGGAKRGFTSGNGTPAVVYPQDIIKVYD